MWWDTTEGDLAVDRNLDVAVVGGAVAGLAAAERLRTFADVTLYERQSYEDKRVNCGEAVNDATLIPLEKSEANGFHNDVDAFDLADSIPRPKPGVLGVARST